MFLFSSGVQARETSPTKKTSRFLKRAEQTFRGQTCERFVEFGDLEPRRSTQSIWCGWKINREPPSAWTSTPTLSTQGGTTGKLLCILGCTCPSKPHKYKYRA